MTTNKHMLQRLLLCPSLMKKFLHTVSLPQWRRHQWFIQRRYICGKLKTRRCSSILPSSVVALLTPGNFGIFRNQNQVQVIQLTDAINILNQRSVYLFEFKVTDTMFGSVRSSKHLSIMLCNILRLKMTLKQYLIELGK